MMQYVVASIILIFTVLYLLSQRIEIIIDVSVV